MLRDLGGAPRSRAGGASGRPERRRHRVRGRRMAGRRHQLRQRSASWWLTRRARRAAGPGEDGQAAAAELEPFGGCSSSQWALWAGSSARPGQRMQSCVIGSVRFCGLPPLGSPHLGPGGRFCQRRFSGAVVAASPGPCRRWARCSPVTAGTALGLGASRQLVRRRVNSAVADQRRVSPMPALFVLSASCGVTSRTTDRLIRTRT